MPTTDLDDLLAGLRGDPAEPEGTAAEALAEDTRELVVEKATGRLRQAGAVTAEGAAIEEFRRTAERNLYVFCKGVLGLDRLNATFHRGICDWLQRIPPRRKMLLAPRDHLKTSIGARALPIHILIQPPSTNVYFPGRDGRNTRIVLMGETVSLASKQLGWIEAKFEKNRVLRALWPHCCWDNVRRDTKRWNTEAALLPRPLDFPEASIEVTGVDAAITGAHYDVFLKDDLTTFAAANSQVVAQAAIQWHEATRDLADDHSAMLEFIFATRWSVHDLPGHIIDTDPTVEVMVRQLREGGRFVFPEMFNEAIEDGLRRNRGTLFPLLYYNDATDPALTDFNLADVRGCRVDAEGVHWDPDARDGRIAGRFAEPPPRLPGLDRGRPLHTVLAEHRARDEYLHLKGDPYGRH